jgi:ectoine hydroxylase-related dioxygenase (phytanoyl-CoA dioxygenase family)
MLDPKHFAEIEERGFTVVKDVVTASQVAALKAAVERALAEEWSELAGRPGKEPHLAVELLHRGGPFVDLLENDVMHEVFSTVLGSSCTLYCFNSAIMPPKQATYAQEIHVDQNIWIPGYTARLLMTLALDDFTEENGATFHMPGSHRLDVRPTREEFHASAVRVTRSAGDAVFFNCRNWHAGGTNTTDVTRHAIGVQACRHYMKQRFDYPRMLGPSITARLSSRAARFVGLHSQPPASLDEYYRSPAERGYRPEYRQDEKAESA